MWALVVLLAAALTLLPALAIWVAELLVGLVSELVARFLHLAAVAALFTLLAIQAGKQLTGLGGPGLVAAGVAGGLLGAALHAWQSWLRLWLRFLAPALYVDPTAREAGGRAALQPSFRFDRVRLNQPARFNDFLAGLRASDRPTLHFLHLLLPHMPWRNLPSGREYNHRSLGRAFANDRVPAQVVELGHQRHLLQVAYTDRLLGQVMDRLRAEGMWDRSLVVVGADHGIAWVPGEKARELGRANVPDLMWVPQFIKAGASSTTATGSRSTCCPRSPTWPGSPCRGPCRATPRPAPRPGPGLGPGSGGTTPPAAARSATGPSNWRAVLAGQTDTQVRASDGVRGLWRFGAAAGLVCRDPAATRLPPSWTMPGWTMPGSTGGRRRVATVPRAPGAAADRFAVITPDFLWTAGDGRRQLQVYLVDRSGGGPRLRPVSWSRG